jgi:hypothetical protein
MHDTLHAGTPGVLLSKLQDLREGNEASLASFPHMCVPCIPAFSMRRRLDFSNDTSQSNMTQKQVRYENAWTHTWENTRGG